jgi:hypothetical protein
LQAFTGAQCGGQAGHRIQHTQAEPAMISSNAGKKPIAALTFTKTNSSSTGKIRNSSKKHASRVPRRKITFQ